MPEDADFEFGRRAVAGGLLSQSKLDEAIALLHSLERAGSRKRLWDVVADRGWMTEQDVTRFRAAAGAATPAASPPGGEAGVSGAAGAAPGAIVIAHILPREEPRMFHLLQRPMNIGNDKKSDILVEETGVERRHARLTRGERGPTIWDVGTDIGVLVNGVRKTSCELRAGDLIKMGEALLLALLEPQAGAVIPEPLSPTLIEGEPVAKLHVDQGLRRGETFYMSRRPLVIGRHRLAGVRLEDRRVAPFHIHLAPTPSGIRITDLKSSSGVRINDKTVTEALLRTGDLIEIGEAHLRFEQTGEVAPPEPEPPEAQQEAQADDLPDIPLTAELDMGDKAGAGALGAAGQAAAAPPVERYGPGDLVLTAVEGPIQGQFKAIEKPRTIVGRGGVADLVIPDLSVSRKHALIMLSPQGVLEIQDLGSRNGIHVNGRKVTKAALKAGDAIRIGTTVLMVDRRAP